MITSEIVIITSDNLHEYTTSSLTNLLKEKPDDFRIIKKEKAISNCWSIFGQPARKNKEDTYVPIEGFVSCSKCFKTYVHNSNTGTKTLNAHLCVKQFLADSNDTAKENISLLEDTHNNAISATLSTSRLSMYSPLNRMGMITRKNLSEKEKAKIKDLSAFWLCGALRPFSIMDDIGLRRLVQECINIGAKYGCLDVDVVLRHRTSISKHIKQLAITSRENLTAEFIEPLSAQALTIIPDLWSDKYNQVSFLGATVSYVDANFNFHCFDLFCREYEELNKQSQNIIIALRKNLMDFNIHDLSSVNFCSDRGSNFVKCLKQFCPVHCYAHRINNILSRTFFGKDHSKKMKQFLSSIPTSKDENYESSSSEDDSECHESDDESIPTMKMKKTKKVNASSMFTTDSTAYKKINHIQLKLVDLPSEAQAIVEQIYKAKKLVKYIKKAGLNQEICDIGGSTLKQCTQVRWLSLSETLISIVNSYSQIKTVLLRKGQAGRMNGIDKDDMAAIVQLLIPFKVILTAVQYGAGPSLYMVLLSTLQLRRVLSSTSELCHFCKIYYKQHNRSNEVNDDATLPKKSDNVNEDDDAYYFEVEECDDDDESFRNDSINKTADEVTQYLLLVQKLNENKNNENPLPWWNEHKSKLPKLSILARRLFSIPATSASVERQFSSAGLVYTDRRNRLDGAQLDNVLLVRAMNNANTNEVQ
ncbi:unnamed protein product [Rotaria sp. Silwood2]|nr:unnamed protein product [Rotaria sp. Silwood2]CAF4308716.1 unnamed protein product [Rotaria sp. Silwood2]